MEELRRVGDGGEAASWESESCRASPCVRRQAAQLREPPAHRSTRVPAQTPWGRRTAPVAAAGRNASTHQASGRSHTQGPPKVNDPQEVADRSPGTDSPPAPWSVVSASVRVTVALRAGATVRISCQFSVLSHIQKFVFMGGDADIKAGWGGAGRGGAPGCTSPCVPQVDSAFRCTPLRGDGSLQGQPANKGGPSGMSAGAVGAGQYPQGLGRVSGVCSAPFRPPGQQEAGIGPQTAPWIGLL